MMFLDEKKYSKMSSLQQELRALVANHGFEKVHTTLHEMMRHEYAFLTRIFKIDAAPVTAPVTAAVEAPSAPQDTENLTPAKVKNMKVTVKKSATEPAPEPALEPVPEPTPAQNVVETPQTVEPSTEESKFRNPLEMKEFQRLAVEKKHAELEAQGISGKELLTKENLKKWIEEEGNTYAWVAREKVGCPEADVSALAKSYGITSKISKKRGMTIAQWKASSSTS